MRRLLLLCLLLTATAGCDRVTKHLALTALAGHPERSFLGDTIRLEYHENPGAFLSLGADWHPDTQRAVFQVANAVFLTGIAIVALSSSWSRLAAGGLMLISAGGVSNLIDRIAVGRVIDFLNVGIGPLRTGIFNVADVAIMAGVALLLIDVWRQRYTGGVNKLHN